MRLVLSRASSWCSEANSCSRASSLQYRSTAPSPSASSRMSIGAAFVMSTIFDSNWGLGESSFPPKPDLDAVNNDEYLSMTSSSLEIAYSLYSVYCTKMGAGFDHLERS